MNNPSATPSTNFRAILWMVAAAFVFAHMSALVKYLGDRLHGFEIAFFRSIFGFIALLPAIISEGGLNSLKTSRPGLHILRIILGGITMLSLFHAMTVLPLASAKTLSFSQPLFMLALAPFFLNEKVGWHRGSAVAIGFVGLVIAANPGAHELSPAAMVAIGGAFTMACAMIVVKKLAATESPITIMAFFSVAAIFITAFPAYSVWVQPTWTEIALLAVVGALGSFGQYLYIRAYKIGEASVVAPFNFLQIPFAGIIAYLAFSEIPESKTIIGGCIIVSSAIYIMRREAVLQRQTVTVQTTPTSG